LFSGKVVKKRTVTLVLEIGQDQELEQTFHAVENLDFGDTDVILGIDFMEKHKIEFAYQRDGNVMKTRKYEVKLAKNEYAEKVILNVKKNKIELLRSEFASIIHIKNLIGKFRTKFKSE
jgi:hypothetical protein